MTKYDNLDNTAAWQVGLRAVAKESMKLRGYKTPTVAAAVKLGQA
ncbi:MAG TPA: hypothetical protein VFM35_08205 [Candidatus Binatia bacterium]|nr:hypothetical protein [Candidatus Binatia bacterium]